MNRRVFTLSLLAGLVPALGLVLGSSLPLSAADVAPTPEPGTLVIVAGTGQPGFTGDDGPATQARLRTPTGLAIDAVGNLYIADWANHRVRKVGMDGTITTFAGTGKVGSSGDNGPAREARLNYPNSMAFDTAGNLYIAEGYGHRVRRVSPDGIITTVAGTGKQAQGGTSGIGDGGPAIDASLAWPCGVALDREGNLFITEPWVYRVRRVSADGRIATVAGTGTRGSSGDGGPATQARLNNPHFPSVDSAGNLYIAEWDDKSKVGGRVRKVSPDGIITSFAGNGPPGFSGDNGLATEAQLKAPFGVTVDSAGNLFIADYGNARVRKVSPDGIITTVAGGGSALPSVAGGPATAARLRMLTGLAVDAAGNLFISESAPFESGARDWVYKVYGVAVPGLIGSQLFPQPQQ
jgi:sugar lactone lactonase YvrE